MLCEQALQASVSPRAVMSTPLPQFLHTASLGVLHDQVTEEEKPKLGSWRIQPTSQLGHFSVCATGS